jgi:tRNA A37 threonylcarbamoyladenosine synthetase subunit TsaC/SUA5/YrdC
MVSSTLLLPGDEVPMTQGWEIKDRLDPLIDAVIDSGECGEVPTTVIDFSSGEPVVVRYGAGDASRFE